MNYLLFNILKNRYLFQFRVDLLVAINIIKSDCQVFLTKHTHTHSYI